MPVQNENVGVGRSEAQKSGEQSENVYENKGTWRAEM
jgi:hypothetical protein